MAQSKILVGLEIGTSKTCMVVGETHPNSALTIIGVGEVPSAGVRKGEIVDQSMARQCVCDAWQLAQDHADVDILNVFLSVTGEHIYGENRTGSYRLPDDEDVIEDEHADFAKENASDIDNELKTAGRFPINTELGGYSIDGGEPTYHPAGLTGRTLDVNCHITHGIRTRVQNSLHCVRQIPLEVEEIVFAPLATAQVVLGRQQKEAGALLIDIGGGTTDFVCYKGGDLVASGCIPAGGNTINQDIMKLTDQRFTFKAAEVLKCTEGSAFGDVKDKSYAQYRSDTGMHDVRIERGLLNRIIRDRLADTLLRVRDRVPEEALRQSGMAIYFSGGASLMRGLDQLAHYIFRLPVNQPAPLQPGQNHSYLSDPRYCTAIGLTRYAQRFDDDAAGAEPNLLGRIINFFRRTH